MCWSYEAYRDIKNHSHVSGENGAVEETFITPGDGKPTETDIT